FVNNLLKEFEIALKENETILGERARKLKAELILGRTLSTIEFTTLEKVTAKNVTNLKEQLDNSTLSNISIEDLQNLIDYQFKSTNLSFPYRVIEEFKGSDLVGIKYEQLLPWALPFEDADKAFQVIDGDFVTTEDGTGI